MLSDRLEEVMADPDLVETIRGVGYRLERPRPNGGATAAPTIRLRPQDRSPSADRRRRAADDDAAARQPARPAR